MKQILLGCLSFVSASVFSATPTYYGEVHGTILTGLLERGDFDFTPGTLSNCTMHDVGTLISYSCDVTGAVAKVSNGAGKTLSVSFPKVWVANAKQDKGWTWEYRFTTTYKEEGRVPLATESVLTLWNYDNVLTDIKGSLSFTNYGVYGGIQAIGTKN